MPGENPQALEVNEMINVCRLVIALSASAWFTLCAHATIQKPIVKNVVPMALEGFDYGDLKLLDGTLKRAFEKNRDYLHRLSPDHYLYMFRKTAGLPAPGEPYGGWERPDCELRGHSIGHYLSACARTIATCGDSVLKENADYTVRELAKCQAAHGNGYLSAYPSSFFDRLEEKYGRVWAPYYTMHKVMVGLWEMYAYTRNKQALDLLKGMADYFKGRCDELSDEQMQRVLNVEFGGMEEVLLNLYSSTGQKKYLDLALRFEHQSFLDPLAEDKDVLTGRHANTHIPKIAGAARAYELTGNVKGKKILSFFWDTVASTRTFATGGSNNGEHWGPPNKLAETLTMHTQEFCTSYNWLKICRYLLRWTGENKYADMYERNFYNGILVSQNPETAMLIYFLPLKTGGRKSFGTPFNTFTCCYGTGIQSYAGLTEGIYFHTDDALYVNLYANSEVNWHAPFGEMRLIQRTGYPETPSTRMTVHLGKPTKFKIALRIPWWAVKGLRCTVNREGLKEAAKAEPGSWLVIERTWRDGDQIELTLLMSLHTQPINDDPTLAAIMYGPLVLAGLIEDSGVLLPTEAEEQVFTGDMKDPSQWIKPVAGKALTFRTEGQPINLTFVPIHKVVDETYGVYWQFVEPDSPRVKELLEARQERRQREARRIDLVHIGDGASEKAHDLRGERTSSGSISAGRWRHAVNWGWFSYRLKVEPQSANTVLVTFWGSDYGKRTFNILVEGQEIAQQTLCQIAPGRLFQMEYPIPKKLTQGKQSAVVRFQAASPQDIAGGIFGLATLRAEESAQ